MTARSVPRLFVGNIPWTVGRKELRDYFAQFGPIQHAHVFFEKATGLSRSFGFVQFNNRESYLQTTSQHLHYLEGNKLTVADVHAHHKSGGLQNNQSMDDIRTVTDTAVTLPPR